MPDKPLSDLRRRMLADMSIRSFGDKTRREYIRHVETLAAFLGRSPDTATADDLRRFQQHQVDQGAQPPKLNSQATALRFLFTRRHRDDPGAEGPLPSRSEAEIVWAFQMMIGTMLYIMVDGGRAKHLSGGACDPEGVEGTMRLILPLLLHGMRGADN